MKILCLIIDSIPHRAWRDSYASHRRIWNKCLDCSNVEGYFLYSDPGLAKDHVVESRRFTVRGEERYDTILHKTLKAIEVLLGRHEYVVRTNISSLYDFALLRRKNLPKKGLYAGHVWSTSGSFVSGSGMILSRDVAKKLLSPPADVKLSHKDDVAIGQILRAHGVAAREEPWFCYDYSKGLEQVVVGKYVQYRFRDVNDPSRAREHAAAENVCAVLYPGGHGSPKTPR